MTYRDVFVAVIAEATQAPSSKAKDLFEAFLLATRQTVLTYKEELLEEEAMELFTALRKEKTRIRGWFEPGGLAFRDEPEFPHAA